MDESVIRAMQRWPNVPDVYGWLRLDRRGHWLLRTGLVRTETGPDGRVQFERIGNTAFVDFISRNYQPDARGRWYFQNGPQRVFVALDGAPWVFRLDDAGRDWLAHTGAPAGVARKILFDEKDAVWLVTGLGAGGVLDRDLPALLDALCGNGGQPIDPDVLVSNLRAGLAQHVELHGTQVLVEAVAEAALASRFGFDPEPGA